jgi:hypothetical protein
VYVEAIEGAGGLCNGHCTVPCCVPGEDEVADAAPAPSALMPPPTASPIGVSNAFGFIGAGPDLRPQIKACAIQRNALVQHASRVGMSINCALCVRNCYQTLSRNVSSVLSSWAYTCPKVRI